MQKLQFYFPKSFLTLKYKAYIPISLNAPYLQLEEKLHMDLGLQGQIAVITGADSGIGKATAKLLIQEGAKIALIDKTKESIEQAAFEIEKYGEVLALGADLTKLEEVEAAKREILEHFGTVNILVHAAGITGATEDWYDKDGKAFRPQTGYWVGGNTKVYGAALLRLRERDFEQVIHKGGISPEWELKYQDFEPYYTQAEKLYDVHGERGTDPTEPPCSEAFPYPAVSHEPDMQELADCISKLGYNPFNLPLGMKLNEVDRSQSLCIRCDTFDGYPCLVGAKADSEVNAIRPTREAYPNVKLLTHAKVLKLHTSESGREVTAVETDINGELHYFKADIVVVACGAINSAALLLRSANDKHPHGLANSSDQVGRNFMKHQAITLLAIHAEPNRANFQKTIAVNDFYWGEPDFPYPMGMVQNTGNVLADDSGRGTSLISTIRKIDTKLWTSTNCRTLGRVVVTS